MKLELDDIIPLADNRVSDEISFIDAAEELERACDWLKSLGIDFSRTRVGRYRALFSDLATAQLDNRFDVFDAKYSHAEFVNAAYERSELVNIYTGLQGLADTSLIGRLKDAIKGHELYVMDTADRSGRDFSLELAVAAHFARKGYSIDFDTDADMKVDFGEFHLYVECKRLKSPKKVEHRIKDAIAQLNRRYRLSRESALARGILVVSIGRIINNKLGQIVGKQHADLGIIAGEINRQFIHQYKHLWQKPGRDKRLLGAAVILDAPATVEGSGKLQMLHEVALHTSAPEMTLDRHRALRVSTVFSGSHW